MPPFPPIGIVGVTVLGAAGADGVPKLACVASQGGYPDMVTDIVAMGPSFESCSPNLDLSKLTNFWSRGKDAEGNWNGKDAEVATGATQIAGQTATESSYEACMRIGQASYDWAEANRPMGQITNYADFPATFKLDTEAVTGCPRTGGPTCPTGADAPTCPAGFEGRGGTLDGTRTFLANTFGHQAAEEFAMEYCCTMRRSRKLLFASMAQPSCTEWSCAGI